MLGRDGDVDRMLAVHDEVVTFLRDLWGVGRVAAEVRLAALAVGHLATAIRTAPPARRASLLAEVEQRPTRPWRSGAAARCAPRRRDPLLAPARDPAPSSPPTLEGRAWEARARAERQRARWAAGEDVPVEAIAAAPREVVDMFEKRGEPFEVARTRGRLAEVLVAAGDRSADDVVAAALATAQDLGAKPLEESLGQVAPSCGPRGDSHPA